MKIVAIVLLAIVIAGCTQDSELTIVQNSGSRIICVNGVSYMRWDKGITVIFDTNSKIVPCGEPRLYQEMK
jgi:hypothetical protein